MNVLTRSNKALSTHLDDYASLILGLAILSFGLATLRDAWRTRRWPGDSSPSSTQAIGGHLEGHTCRVFYDPARPESAVLSPGPTLAHYAVTMLGALSVAIVLKDLFMGQN